MYVEYFDELVKLCNLVGVSVVGKQSEDFDLDIYGNFDPIEKTIIIYFENEPKITATVLFTLCHEFRHAFQYFTNMHPEYWRYICGYGPKPDTSVKDAIEADADAYASMYLKGRGIRVPKNCKVTD